MRDSLVTSILSEASIDVYEMSTVTNKTEPQDLQCSSACLDPSTWILAFFSCHIEQWFEWEWIPTAQIYESLVPSW